MRKAALSSLVVAPLAAGAVSVGALAGGHSARAAGPKPLDVARTAHEASVHYAVRVTLTKHDVPMTLHLSGGASRNQVAVHLRLDDLNVGGATMPGATGELLLSTPYLYERAPGGVAVDGMRWLRLVASQHAGAVSTLRALTPAPLLRIVAETKLSSTHTAGGWSGAVAYADPVVATALHALSGGTQFRDLQLFVHVGTRGLIDSIRLTGRTPDRSMTLALHASLFGFGTPVDVVPPKPGTFLDTGLEQIQA